MGLGTRGIRLFPSPWPLIRDMTNDLYPTHVADLLSKRAELTPERVGLLDAETGVAYTYRQLNARANRAANYLRGLGVVKGDRVAILAQNSVVSVSYTHLDVYKRQAQGRVANVRHGLLQRAQHRPGHRPDRR